MSRPFVLCICECVGSSENSGLYFRTSSSVQALCKASPCIIYFTLVMATRQALLLSPLNREEIRGTEGKDAETIGMIET